MDDVRGQAAYKYTAPWHYTNIDSGATYKPASAGDIITTLNKAYGELQHMDTLSPERLRFDVLALMHLCGDLTQPLHVGYGSDKGGNTYQVQYNGKGTNLHQIWDSEIIESKNITLTSLTHNTPFVDSISAQDKLRKMPIDFIWQMKVSRNLLKYVYSIQGHKLDDDYMQNAGVLVRDQLYRGGYLLAACLEQLFSQAKNIPVVKDPDIIKQPENMGDTVLAMLAVPVEQVAAHIGETVFVCSKVYSTRFLGGSGPTFLNMGGDYPNNPFTAVIMFKNRGSFTYKPEEYLNGKTICVTGTVIEYKGKPEIIVDKENQIKVQ